MCGGGGRGEERGEEGSFQKLTHLLIVEIAKDFIVFIRQKELLSFTSCSLSCDSHVTSTYICVPFLGESTREYPCSSGYRLTISDGWAWLGLKRSKRFTAFRNLCDIRTAR